MPITHPSAQQFPTVFGGEFVAEHHREELEWNLPPLDVVESLTASLFTELMKSLRATLGIR